MQDNEGVKRIFVTNNPYTRRARSIYTWLLCNATRRLVLKEIGHMIAVMIYKQTRINFLEYYENEQGRSHTIPYLVNKGGSLFWSTEDGVHFLSPCHVCFMPVTFKLVGDIICRRCTVVSHTNLCVHCGIFMRVDCPIAKHFLNNEFQFATTFEKKCKIMKVL